MLQLRERGLLFPFNSGWATTCSLKVCSQTCFQCCLKLHKQRKTAGLGQVDSKLGWPRHLRPEPLLPPAAAWPGYPACRTAHLPGACCARRLACRSPARGPRPPPFREGGWTPGDSRRRAGLTRHRPGPHQ